MFAGIIKHISKVKSLRRFGNGMQLILENPFPLENLEVGDSISIDGVCLTLEEFDQDRLRFFVSSQTLLDTTLGRLRVGRRVNVEESLRFGDKIGGHLLTGHINAVGRISFIRSIGRDYRTRIQVVKGNLDLKTKGSIGVDGMSLTIQDYGHRWFEVIIIPHTYSVTTLKYKRAGDLVNLEG